MKENETINLRAMNEVPGCLPLCSLDRLLFQRRLEKDSLKRKGEKGVCGFACASERKRKKEAARWRERERERKQVEPKGKIRVEERETEGEFGCAYDVKHGPVIWRKFRALCRGNCIGVSMPPCASFPTALSFSFFILLFPFFFQGFVFHREARRLKGFLIK